MDDNKNFKKCHSRNLDQTDLILDFLSTLDKAKAGYTWEEELQQINQDWSRMMETADTVDTVDTVDSVDTVDTGYRRLGPESPSKRVTWSEKLTAVKTISPKQQQQARAGEPDRAECLARLGPAPAPAQQETQRQRDLGYKPQPRAPRPLPRPHHHHHGGPGPGKLRLVSVLPHNL